MCGSPAKCDEKTKKQQTDICECRLAAATTKPAFCRLVFTGEESGHGSTGKANSNANANSNSNTESGSDGSGTNRSDRLDHQKFFFVPAAAVFLLFCTLWCVCYACGERPIVPQGTTAKFGDGGGGGGGVATSHSNSAYKSAASNDDDDDEEDDEEDDDDDEEDDEEDDSEGSKHVLPHSSAESMESKRKRWDAEKEVANAKKALQMCVQFSKRMPTCQSSMHC
jgi:hypothetical protein